MKGMKRMKGMKGLRHGGIKIFGHEDDRPGAIMPGGKSTSCRSGSYPRFGRGPLAQDVSFS